MTVKLRDVRHLKLVTDTRERESDPLTLIDRVEGMENPQKDIRNIARQKGFFR